MALIRDIGGIVAYLCTLVVLAGCIGFPIIEWFAFQGVVCSVAVVALTTLGWGFRKSIMEIGPTYKSISNRILFTYGIALFTAKYLGYDYHVQLIVITIATAVMFNLNFWSISEAAIEDQANAREDPS